MILAKMKNSTIDKVNKIVNKDNGLKVNPIQGNYL
jgi:hypothetical protein